MGGGTTLPDNACQESLTKPQTGFQGQKLAAAGPRLPQETETPHTSHNAAPLSTNQQHRKLAKHGAVQLRHPRYALQHNTCAVQLMQAAVMNEAKSCTSWVPQCHALLPHNHAHKSTPLLPHTASKLPLRLRQCMRPAAEHTPLLAPAAVRNRRQSTVSGSRRTQRSRQQCQQQQNRELKSRT